MNKLHNFLQTTKGRLIFFGIPSLLCITGLIYIFIHISLGFFPIPLWIRIFYIITGIITLINLGILIWSDNKKYKDGLS